MSMPRKKQPRGKAFWPILGFLLALSSAAFAFILTDPVVTQLQKSLRGFPRDPKVPIIVAINKIDKPDINIDRVKKELSELGLQPEEWGGKTVMLPISALKKQGITELLEMIILNSDILQPRANAARAALASVVESRLDKNVGPLAVVLVHTGTLKPGDNVVVGRTAGRVRRLMDFRNKNVAEATPGMPVTVVGLEGVPQAGDILQAVEAKGEARVKARARRAPVKSLSKHDENDTRPTLALVLKADSQGSLEAIEQVIKSMVPVDIRLSIVRSEAGYVTDSDVLTAQASGALIYAFTTKVLGMAKKLADKEHVSIRMFNIIYQLSEDVRKEIENRLPVDIVRHDEGRLKVLKVFFSIQSKKIVGGDVAAGKLAVGHKVIIWRRGGGDQENIGHGLITELQKEKRAVTQAEQGDQVGLTIEGKGKIKAGDVLEIYSEEKVRRPMTIA